MEPYLKDFLFIESMVIHPKYLNSSLCGNLRLMINNKYPETYQNKGYIFNICVDSVLNNRISLYGQIIFEVKFASNLYIPTIGHVFKGKVHKSQKYQWIKIGPLLIYLMDTVEHKNEEDEVTVQITSVKSDNTTCYGKVLR
jgi:DNA-directed RNA polymerase subunit E'/Rpb7